MPSRLAFESAGHVMSTEPAADETLTSTGTGGSAGGKENIGTATSMTFDSGAAYFKCIDTLTGAVTPPSPPPVGVVNDGTESCATPYISVTGISIPSSWTVPATGKTETLSGANTAPNNTGTGTYTIFPDVQIVISAGASTGGAGVAGSTKTTQAQIVGPVMELDNWVVPWNPVDSTPNFDGSDFGKARSSGYGKEVGIFYITFTLSFKLLDFVDGAATASPIPLNYQIGVINNYDNDRDVYMAAYEKAYGSLTKVPELSEWQT